MCDSRGAVAVLVALMMPLFAVLMAFAVDTGNWWTHTRHLQTQADAGAFAGAQGPWFPACDELSIEQNANDYSGVAFNKQYQPSGAVTVLLNSTAYSDKGGGSFSDGGTPCQTLASSTADNPAFLDVKATEAGLANIFGNMSSLFGGAGFSSVTTHAHARVEIQGVQEEEAVRPIAVRNPSLYQCAHAQLWTTDSNGNLASKLGPEFTSYSRSVLSDTSTQFQITGTATMPSKGDSQAPHVAVQVILGNAGCVVTDTFADPPGTNGVDFINVYKSGITVGNGQPPELGSVSMPPGLSNCDPDPYFATNGCTAVVKAYVTFAPGAVTSGSGKNAFVAVNGVDAVAATDVGGLYWTAAVPVGSESGPNPITIDWKQKFGSVPNGNNPNPKDCSKGQGCSGSFDVAQQAFGATNDEDFTNSGDIDLVQIADGSGLYANSLVQGSTHNFTITVRVKGLENSKPTDPPVVLRNSNQNSKRTGLVDCGQGDGANADKAAIVNGCPLGVYIWPEGTGCVLPNNDPIDCVTAIPGNRRQKIASAIKDRINGGCNYWNAYRDSGSFDINNYIQPSDPRLLPLIITEPADLAGNTNGDPIPVRAIATFYVTGYDGGAGNGQGCANEPYPGKGSDKFQVWGHWIKYVPVGGGVGNGQGCDPTKFGDCIAVLTQ
ncbi:MAG: pilus assembly protein TadG-related protein [Verrucomicrobiota bacterium]